MANSNIAKNAARLRWAVWIVWGCILLAYAAGRFGVSFGPVQVRSHAAATDSSSLMIVGDITIVLLSIALWQLSRMLGALAGGDLFTARVVGSFRSFALWLLVVSLLWIGASIAVPLAGGHALPHHYEFQLQLRDFLTVGITLILFLVARLLERARQIDEEMREIV